MDKHERPYVCTVPGCEKVQGFTYSGGLLRHEREVHRKHGGPKNALFCPHPTCKRSGGKGFSRLENLQEHLRRVHTTSNSSTTLTTTTAAAMAAQLINSPLEEAQHQAPSPESTSDVASATYAFMHVNPKSPDASLVTLDGHDNSSPSGHHGHKRKRSSVDVGGGRDNGVAAADYAAAQEEIKSLRDENYELRRQLLEQTRHVEEMRAQLQAVGTAISQTLAGPQPPAL